MLHIMVPPTGTMATLMSTVAAFVHIVVAASEKEAGKEDWPGIVVGFAVVGFFVVPITIVVIGIVPLNVDFARLTIFRMTISRMAIAAILVNGGTRRKKSSSKACDRSQRHGGWELEHVDRTG